MCLLSDSKPRLAVKVERYTVPVPQFLPWSHGFSIPLTSNNGCSLGQVWVFGLCKPTCSFASYFHTVPQPRESPRTSVCGFHGRKMLAQSSTQRPQNKCYLAQSLPGGLVLMDRGCEYSRAQGLWITCFLLLWKRRVGLAVVLFVVAYMGRVCPASPQCSLYLSHLLSLSLFLINLLNASFQSCSQ